MEFETDRSDNSQVADDLLELVNEILLESDKQPISDLAVSLQFERGLDSLAMIELIVAIEQHFGVALPDEVMNPELIDDLGFVASYLIGENNPNAQVGR